MDSFPASHEREAALFSHYLALVDQDAKLQIYDVEDLESGPVRTLEGAQRLGRSNSYLAYAVDGGICTVSEVKGSLKKTTRQLCRSEGLKGKENPLLNVSCGEDYMVIWTSDTAEVFRVALRDNGPHSFESIGGAKMPSCNCHGGWYGSVVDDIFITADAFAGITVMQIIDPEIPRK